MDKDHILFFIYIFYWIWKRDTFRITNIINNRENNSNKGKKRFQSTCKNNCHFN